MQTDEMDLNSCMHTHNLGWVNGIHNNRNKSGRNGWREIENIAMTIVKLNTMIKPIKRFLRTCPWNQNVVWKGDHRKTWISLIIKFERTGSSHLPGEANLSTVTKLKKCNCWNKRWNNFSALFSVRIKISEPRFTNKILMPRFYATALLVRFLRG